MIASHQKMSSKRRRKQFLVVHLKKGATDIDVRDWWHSHLCLSVTKLESCVICVRKLQADIFTAENVGRALVK